MRIQGKIVGYDGTRLVVHGDLAAVDAWQLDKRRAQDVEINIPDGRKISAQQRKLFFALIGCIAEYQGSDPEWEAHLFKCWFIKYTGCEPFSMSNVDMTTANHLIDFLLDHCLEHGVILDFLPAEHLNDKQMGRFLYRCLVHRKCCLCGRHADTHHVDAVGMGRDRDEICHVGMRSMALCREHHNEAHNVGQQAFDELHHVYGIKIDEHLAKVLKLGKTP